MMRLGFLLVSLALTLDVYSAQKMEAGCTMKKHGSGEEIGTVFFMKKGTNKYIVVANLKSDEETMKTGEHGFHVHNNGVDETMGMNSSYSQPKQILTYFLILLYCRFRYDLF